MHGRVHGCFHAGLCLAWGNESGFANFCQRLFSEQKPENSTDAGSVCVVAPVLGADERRAVAQGRSSGFADAVDGGAPQIAGEIHFRAVFIKGSVVLIYGLGVAGAGVGVGAAGGT